MIHAMFRSLLLVVALFAVPPTLVGCSSSPVPKDPAALGGAVRSTARLVYSVGVVSLSKLSDVHERWVDGIAKPTPAELLVIDRTTAGLLAVGASLEKAKPWIDTGKGEAAGKTALRDALKEAQLLAGVLVAAGAPLPPKVVDALTAALEALGGEELEPEAPAPAPPPALPQPKPEAPTDLRQVLADLRGMS